MARRLAEAPSNIPAFRDGGVVWARLIRPAVVDLRRVVAHHAIVGLLEAWPEEAAVHAYRVQRIDEAGEAYGGTPFRVGHVRVSSTVTGEVRDAMYAVLHFGGHDFVCGVRAWEDATVHADIKADLLRRHSRSTVADVVRGMDEWFPGGSFSLTDLFLDERRRVLARVTRATLLRHEETYQQIWEENRKLMHYLRQADAPIPEALGLVARHVLEEAMVSELAKAETRDDGAGLSGRMFELAEEAAALGLRLDLEAGRPIAIRLVRRALGAVAERPTPGRIADAIELLEGANRLGLRYGRWAAQNLFFDTWARHAGAHTVLAPLGEVLGFHLIPEAAA
jgi:hypothetical protein